HLSTTKVLCTEVYIVLTSTTTVNIKMYVKDRNTHVSRCTTCRSREHRFQYCPKNQCNTCGEYGHIMKDCSVKFCTKCKRSGHVYINCPDLQCSNCDQLGHSKYRCPNPRKVINNEARELSQDLLVGNDGNVLYAWKDKNGEIHDTKEINWEANWPPC